MRTKWMVWVAVLTLVFTAAAVTTRAQDRPAGPPPGPAVGPGGDPGGGEDVLGEIEFGDDLGSMLAAGFGEDDPPGAEGRGRGGARMQALRKELNLTEEQRTKIADIHDRAARAVIPIQSDLRIAGLDMRKLMRADKPDARAIDAQIDKMAGLRAKLQKSRVSAMLEARAVLTPSQQKILRDARPGMLRHGMRGMGRMHGMDGMHGDGMDMRTMDGGTHL